MEGPERDAQIAALAALRQQLEAPGDPTQQPLDRAAEIVLELLYQPERPSTPRSAS
jgi:hypothetical protein